MGDKARDKPARSHKVRKKKSSTILGLRIYNKVGGLIRFLNSKLQGGL